MNQGLVAPQFGVRWPADPAPSPTVVVKRRRWSRPADEAPAAEGGDGDAERAPKVYRVESARPQVDEPAAAAAPEVETAPPPLRRRRPDPSTRPQLIRHDVFEVAAPAPVVRVEEDGLAPSTQQYDRACRMLEEIRQDLAFADSARRFVESFRLPETAG